jgi:hypothetical protein
MPNPHTGGPPLVSCLPLLIQYIHSYPLYLEAISIRNVRMHHAMVARDPPNMEADIFCFRSELDVHILLKVAFPPFHVLQVTDLPSTYVYQKDVSFEGSA